MNNQTLLKKGSTLLAASLVLAMGVGFSGCGQGFSAQGLQSAANGSSGIGDNIGGGSNGGSGNSGSSSQEAFKSYSTEGRVAGGQEDDREVFDIDKENKMLIVHLPISANPFLDGMQLTVTIKEIPGAELIVGPNAAGTKTQVTIKVPLSHVLNGVDFIPPSKLPNGDNLPAIADGELPSVAVNLSKLGNINASIYLAPSVVGLYVNSPVNPYLQLTFPIRNKAKTKIWGYFSTVPAKGNYQGGFFISVTLPDDLARIIDDIL